MLTLPRLPRFRCRNTGPIHVPLPPPPLLRLAAVGATLRLLLCPSDTGVPATPGRDGVKKTPRRGMVSAEKASPGGGGESMSSGGGDGGPFRPREKVDGQPTVPGRNALPRRGLPAPMLPLPLLVLRLPRLLLGGVALVADTVGECPSFRGDASTLPPPPPPPPLPLNPSLQQLSE